jgi:hypothetical protein
MSDKHQALIVLNVLTWMLVAAIAYGGVFLAWHAWNRTLAMIDARGLGLKFGAAVAALLATRSAVGTVKRRNE